MSVQMPLFEKADSKLSKVAARVEEIVGGGFGVEKFAENFEILVHAAGGIAAMKRLVLELAIRGRLTASHGVVPKDAAQDEPKASFRLPDGWHWGQGRDLFTFVTSGSRGWAKYYAEKGPIFLRIGNLDYETTNLDLSSLQHVQPPSNAEGVRTRVEPGDILISITGDTGMVGLVPPHLGEAYINQHIALARPGSNLVPAFVARALTAPSLLGRLQGAQRGIKNSLGLDDVRRLGIPVPPLAEQKRIVDKVDQLMALCDELEARQTKKRDVGTRLTKSALEALTSAEGPEEFDVAWKRVVDNFGVLIAKAKDVVALRNLVLDLAFRGSLVGPSSSDSSVTVLVGMAEQAWTTRKRKEVLPPVDADECPVSPARWAWHRLGNLAEVVGGVTKGRDLKGRKVRAYPYLRVANVQRGYLDLSEMKDIEIPEDEISKYRLLPGDVLFTEGGDWDKLGRSAVWGGEIDACIHQNHVFRARLVVPELDSRWFSMFANSPVGRRYFENAAKQTTNLASINMTQLRNCPMPVPPPEEKRRIVAKVELLMKMCDDLEAKLRRVEDRASKLVEAVVSEMVV